MIFILDMAVHYTTVINQMILEGMKAEESAWKIK